MQERFRIRKARPAQAEQVRRIAREAYSMYLPRMDREPFPMLDDYTAHIDKGHVHVAETEEGGISGYVVLIPREDGALMLDNIAVAPGARGKGLGRLLIDFSERHAAREGFSKISLYTNAVMTENIEWYRRLGFQETRRAVENGYSRIFFEKRVGREEPAG